VENERKVDGLEREEWVEMRLKLKKWPLRELNGQPW